MFIYIIIWASWLISEILLARYMRAKSPDSKAWDKSSLRIMWITIGISISLGVIFMIYTPLPVARTFLIPYLGLFLILSGVVIRFTAVRTLGNFFTVNLALHKDHRLVTKGLYKFIRHPSYTGALLSFAGLGLSFNNWLSLVIIFIPILLSFIYRINIEEKLLIQQFGQEYIDYMKNTKRLVPFLY